VCEKVVLQVYYLQNQVLICFLAFVPKKPRKNCPSWHVSVTIYAITFLIEEEEEERNHKNVDFFILGGSLMLIDENDVGTGYIIKCHPMKTKCTETRLAVNGSLPPHHLAIKGRTDCDYLSGSMVWVKGI